MTQAAIESRHRQEVAGGSLQGVFITGTDTGVGKTVVAALFTLGWRGEYWKPVQTGARGCTDRARVALWTRLPAARLRAEAYCLPRPVSPHLAAAAAGVRIERRHLRAAATPRPLVVEGAGGLLVPLNERESMIDLIGWLGLPVVLVARTRLGTINHTLLSLEALRRRRLPVAGVVLHGAEQAAVIDTIRVRNQVPVAWLPWLAALDPAGLRAAWTRYLGPQFGIRAQISHGPRRSANA